MLVVGGVARQPDGGEMTPSEFADDDVAAVVVRFADVDGMIATLAVIFRVLFIGRRFLFLGGRR
jgi:hypothetical protein